MTISLATARDMMDEAIRVATANGCRISIVVVDEFGREVCAARMDGANWFTLGVARAKAQTAATFKRHSDTLAPLKEEYPELFLHMDDQLAFRPTTLPGGVPLGAESVVGGVGVSGARPQTDLAIAEAAAAFFATNA